MLRLFAGLVAVTAALGTGCASSAVDVSPEALGGVDEAALDRTVDPCSDFYAFACGGYDAKPLPADTPQQSRRLALLGQAQEPVLLRVFERLQSSPQSPAETTAGIFYRRCLDDDGSGQAATMRRIREELAAVQTSAELAKALGRQIMRSSAPIFQIGSTFEGRRLALTAFAAPELSTSRATLTADVKNALLFHEPAIPDADATAIAEAFARTSDLLASEVAKAVAEDAPETRGLASLSALAPHIDWATFFTTIGVNAPSNDFAVYNPSTFAAIDRTIAALPASDVASFLVGAMYQRFAKLSPRPPESYCRAVTIGALPDAFQRAYLEYAGFGDEARSRAQTMFDAIRSTFADELREDKWLDEPTRAAALAKLNAMQVLIGGPENLDDYAGVALAPTDDFFAMKLAVSEHNFRTGLPQLGQLLAPTDFGATASTINAFYDSGRNRVEIPAGFFGDATFSDRSSSFANFAALGVVVGHEITHGFDSVGRRRDDVGLARDWWSSQASDAFDERAACFVDRYSAFPVPGTKDPVTGSTPAHVDGVKTLAENIADNGGLRTAYRAAKVDAMKTPLYAGFAPPQQFFVAYAQQYCGKFTGDALEELLTDEHAPPKARVNIPLQNFTSFAAAFQCAPGSAMVASTRCEVW